MKEEEKDLLVVTVSGRDRPGIAAALTRVMDQYNADVVDIEQASLQDLLGLSFLLDLSQCTGSQDSLIKDLLFEANRLDLTLNFRLVTAEEFRAVNKKKLFVLTFFGSTRPLAALSAVLGEHRVNIELVSSRTKLRDRCIEMVINVDKVRSLKRLKDDIMAKSKELNCDLALQAMEAYRKNKRLVFFDLDRTLVDMEIIDEMAKEAGVASEVARVTEKAMRGDLDFEESLVHRVALLKGLTVEKMENIRENLRLSEGAEDVTATLKRFGFKLGLVTGGFAFFADFLKEKLNLDFAFANTLEIKNGVLTGRVLGQVLDAAGKARVVNQVARDEGILLDQTVAVGDGANDALMLGQVGLGIAYNAKPALNRVAAMSLGHTRLMNILYLLGITEEDVDMALGRADA
jgi:phosphoserine phosphatase